MENTFFSTAIGEVKTSKDIAAPVWKFTDSNSLFQLKKGSTVGFKDNRPNVFAAVTIERDLSFYST